MQYICNIYAMYKTVYMKFLHVLYGTIYIQSQRSIYLFYGVLYILYMMKCIYHMRESMYSIESSMDTMYRFSNMCNVKVSTKMSSVKAIMFVWDILE
jgi:hypothetical protein